jgi:hypothetical protein
VFGSYKYSKENKKNIRINLFKELTQNDVIINNFKKDKDAYYIVMKGLQPGSDTNVYMYSNFGKYFYNNEVVDDVDTKKDEIIKFCENINNLKGIIKKLGSVSNIFRFKINQRFTIEDSEIKNNRFPGLSIRTGNKDDGVDLAISNHEKIINIINEIKK